MPERPTRVLVVDDHQLFADALSVLLRDEPDIQITGRVSTAEEALQILDAAPADVVLMDIDLPGMDGIEATRRIRETRAGTEVVVVTAMQGGATIVAALEAGAAGFISKAHAANDLIEAIRAAACGQPTLGRPYVASVVASLRDRRAPTDERSADRLTPREREVLRQLVAGRRVPEIAKDLYISVSTLRGHIRGILTKLGVKSIAQAVAMSARDGPRLFGE